MRAVPERLLEKMISMARRHRDSVNKEADSRELAITQRIIEWDERRSIPVGSPPESAPMGPQKPAPEIGRESGPGRIGPGKTTGSGSEDGD